MTQKVCPSDEGTPAMLEHFSLDTEVSAEERDHCMASAS